MKVVIDATCLGRRKTGNETFIRGLLSGFAAHRTQDLGFPTSPTGRIQVLTTEAHLGERSDAFEWIDIPKGNFFVRNFLTIPNELRRLQADCFYATYWTRWWDHFPKKVVMVHDISFVSFPQGFHKHEQLFYANVVKQCARNADHVCTVSEFSRQDISEKWKIPLDRITVTYDGLDDCFVPLEEGQESRVENLNCPYILYVGNLHPRKNLVRLLEAFVQLKEQEKIEHRLVIVGQKAWLAGDVFQAVREHKLEDEVEFTGYVSQSELIAKYQNATMMVYPSLFEGFGLPVLEAMGCGCPVVTSNTTSIPEVAGNACVLIDPVSVNEIAAGILSIIRDEKFRQELIQRGIVQAQRFSWKDTASKTMDLLERII
ncbi:MAG: glycosyltransferase family 1 protein [Verrucomicrobiota bacterium]